MEGEEKGAAKQRPNFEHISHRIEHRAADTEVDTSGVRGTGRRKREARIRTHRRHRIEHRASDTEVDTNGMRGKGRRETEANT